MATLLNAHPAPGGPGIEPRWSRADKDGVGTAYSALSRVWFTISMGTLNEVYFPTIDRPQLRDLQFLVTDGATFFHDSRRHENSTLEYLAEHTLGFRVTSRDPQGRYSLTKEIIADPHQSCILLHTRLEAEPALLPRLKVFLLLAPHLEGGGMGNNGNVATNAWGKILTAHRDSTWLAAAATVPFLRCSCGYVGVSDGWQDLSDNYQMDWEYDSAPNGNIALMAELDVQQKQEFVVALAFGESLHNTQVVLAQSLSYPFATHKDRYIEQWNRAAGHRQQFIEMQSAKAWSSCRTRS